MVVVTDVKGHVMKVGDFETDFNSIILKTFENCESLISYGTFLSKTGHIRVMVSFVIIHCNCIICTIVVGSI